MTLMGDLVIMSKRELVRKTILDSVAYGKISLQDAAKQMGVSYRQAKRINRRYRLEKEAGLVHKLRGQQSHNAYSKSYRIKIIKQYCSKYIGFGPTYAAEKLLEDDKLCINPETLRLWLKAEGLWTRKRKHKVYRERRERRARFGELLQIDGSIHAWMPKDEEHYCLLNIVDDATGLSFANLGKGETTWLLLSVLQKWIERYGVPKAVYVDLKSVYVSPKHLKDRYDDDVLLKEGFSVFEQVCKRLNIEIIRAYSAQAKGRVERKHAVYQDRLVKDLKLYNIKTIDAANAYLENTFLNKINQKYAVSAASEEDAHRPAKAYGDLSKIICWHYQRQLKNDWTIRLKNEYYQIRKPADLHSPLTPKPNEFILIRKQLDGRLEFWYNEMRLEYGCLSRKPEPPSRSKSYYVPKGKPASSTLSENAKRNKHKSPWSRCTKGWLMGDKKKRELAKQNLSKV